MPLLDLLPCFSPWPSTLQHLKDPAAHQAELNSTTIFTSDPLCPPWPNSLFSLPVNHSFPRAFPLALSAVSHNRHTLITKSPLSLPVQATHLTILVECTPASTHGLWQHTSTAHHPRAPSPLRRDLQTITGACDITSGSPYLLCVLRRATSEPSTPLTMSLLLPLLLCLL